MKYRIIEQVVNRELIECACRLNNVEVVSIKKMKVSINDKRKDEFMSVIVDAKFEEDLYYVGRYVGAMVKDK